MAGRFWGRDDGWPGRFAKADKLRREQEMKKVKKSIDMEVRCGACNEKFLVSDTKDDNGIECPKCGNSEDKNLFVYVG